MLWVEPQQATPVVAAAPGMSPGEHVHTLQRLRLVDGKPLAIETPVTTGADLTPGMLGLDLSGSLWGILRSEYGLRPTGAAAATQVITLDGSASHHLEVRAAAPSACS